MHELGIVFEISKTVQRFAMENNVKKIDVLVLEVGALSAAIPKYLADCFPAAIEGTVLENATLEIEILPANAICKTCENLYDVVQHQKICPDCKESNYEIISGQELNIKEIRVLED